MGPCTEVSCRARPGQESAPVTGRFRRRRVSCCRAGNDRTVTRNWGRCTWTQKAEREHTVLRSGRTPTRTYYDPRRSRLPCCLCGRAVAPDQTLAAHLSLTMVTPVSLETRPRHLHKRTASASKTLLSSFFTPTY
jgi:hypothetical protein